MHRFLQCLLFQIHRTTSDGTTSVFSPYTITALHRDARGRKTPQEDDLPHYIFPEEPLGIPAEEACGCSPGHLGPDLCFEVEAKLGFGTTSSLWLARDLQYVVGCFNAYQ
jgi:hypothetical protein